MQQAFPGRNDRVDRPWLVLAVLGFFQIEILLGALAVELASIGLFVAVAAAAVATVAVYQRLKTPWNQRDDGVPGWVKRTNFDEARYLREVAAAASVPFGALVALQVITLGLIAYVWTR